MDQYWRITLVHKDRYLARREGREIYCVLAGSLRYHGEFPVVGDWAEVTENPFGDSLIRAITPRKTVFCRPDRSGHADGFVKNMIVQPLVANIDYVFIITSLNNDFSVSRIARYAAAAIAGGAVPVAVLTKADTCPDYQELEKEAAELSPELKVIPVSSYTGMGLDRLKSFFEPGKTIALLGSSGAGKSTLINTLAGRDIMRTSEVREYDSKGRHTTTHREMTELDGTCIIDTPGLRELGMIDAEAGIADTFRDIKELIQSCAFSDCTHTGERGCAVKAALNDGTLSPERWDMYSRLESENNWSKSKKHELMTDIALRRRGINKGKK